jgi:hypothetical protein
MREARVQFRVGKRTKGFQDLIRRRTSCTVEQEEGKMSDDLRKELWEKGVAYLLQEYT